MPDNGLNVKENCTIYITFFWFSKTHLSIARNITDILSIHLILLCLILRVFIVSRVVWESKFEWTCNFEWSLEKRKRAERESTNNRGIVCGVVKFVEELDREKSRVIVLSCCLNIIRVNPEWVTVFLLLSDKEVSVFEYLSCSLFFCRVPCV